MPNEEGVMNDRGVSGMGAKGVSHWGLSQDSV
jgi:hypothetical protein